MYGLTLSSVPADEPVTLAELKQFLRVDISDDDALIASLGVAARRAVEQLSGRQLVTATWVLSLDSFPWPGGWQYLESPTLFADPHQIRMPKAPLVSVASVTYYDLSDTLQTLAATTYDVDARSDPGRVVLAMNKVWPVTRLKPGAVRVTFTAGYGAAAAVPETYKTAIKMACNCWYENRGEAAEAAGLALPAAVQALLGLEWNGAQEYGL